VLLVQKQGNKTTKTKTNKKSCCHLGRGAVIDDSYLHVNLKKPLVSVMAMVLVGRIKETEAEDL